MTFRGGWEGRVPKEGGATETEGKLVVVTVLVVVLDGKYSRDGIRVNLGITVRTLETV